MMYGETRLPSTRCTKMPRPITQSARVPPSGPVRTNSAGSVVRQQRAEERDDGGEPGEHAERQGIRHASSESPIAVSVPRNVIVSSRPTM